MAKLLVVDDEKPIADILKFTFEKEGYQVVCAYDGEEALLLVQNENRTLFIGCDASGPGWHGCLPLRSEKLRCADHHADGQGFRGGQGARPGAGCG